MGKITISHFLNTNLKSYLINKEEYYSIYILVTAKRKSTKIKSLCFGEYYSEKDFQNIMSSDNIEDKNIIQNEANSIRLMSEIIINELNEFDTNFLSAFYNFSNTVDIWKVDNQIFNFNESKVDLYSKEGNLAGIELDKIKIELTDIRGISLYELFNLDNQYKILNILKEQKKYNPEILLSDINKTFFYRSMEFFIYYIQGSKKNKELKDKFEYFFETFEARIDKYITDKYKV